MDYRNARACLSRQRTKDQRQRRINSQIEIGASDSSIIVSAFIWGGVSKTSVPGATVVGAIVARHQVSGCTERTPAVSFSLLVKSSRGTSEDWLGVVAVGIANGKASVFAEVTGWEVAAENESRGAWFCDCNGKIQGVSPKGKDSRE